MLPSRFFVQLTPAPIEIDIFQELLRDSAKCNPLLKLQWKIGKKHVFWGGGNCLTHQQFFLSQTDLPYPSPKNMFFFPILHCNFNKGLHLALSFNNSWKISISIGAKVNCTKNGKGNNCVSFLENLAFLGKILHQNIVKKSPSPRKIYDTLAKLRALGENLECMIEEKLQSISPVSIQNNTRPLVEPRLEP